MRFTSAFIATGIVSSVLGEVILITSGPLPTPIKSLAPEVASSAKKAYDDYVFAQKLALALDGSPSRSSLIAAAPSADSAFEQFLATATGISIDPAWSKDEVTAYITALPTWWPQVPAPVRSVFEEGLKEIGSIHQKAYTQVYGNIPGAVATTSGAANTGVPISTGAPVTTGARTNGTFTSGTPSSGTPPTGTPNPPASGSPAASSPVSTGAASSLKNAGMGAGIFAGALAGLALL